MDANSVIYQNDEAVRFKVHGRHDETLTELPKELAFENRFSVTHAVRLGATRSDGSSAYTFEHLAEDDVIELTFEGDLRRWVTAKAFKQEFGNVFLYERGDSTPTLPAQLQLGDSTLRGDGSWLLKAVRVFKIDPIEWLKDKLISKASEKLAEGTSKALGAWYDERLVNTTGLYRMISPTRLGEKVTYDDLAGDYSGSPILLFIHGTANHTTGSFGEFSTEVWRALEKKYQHILAFEHHTLRQHPIENALELAHQLPEKARLHIVSQSRGGLVGDLLCRGAIIHASDPFDAIDRRLIDNHPQHIKDALDALSATLKEKGPHIERFVRVSSHSGGTTLASGRLDRWLEGILNVMGIVSGADNNPIYNLLTGFLLDVKKTSASPEELPGISAMMPSSALVKMLNRRDVEVDADLAVISGDIEAGSILSRLGVFLADLFYHEDHDLVVHTRAMYGGVKRAPEGRFLFAQGNEVNHFSYFKNPQTVEALRAVLLQEQGLLDDSDFKPLSEARRRRSTNELRQNTYQKRSSTSQPIVFLLPGLMGSHLASNGERIWLDIDQLAVGGLGKLSIDAPQVTPEVPVASSYAGLVDYLSATHCVVPFAYDWRLSIEEEAKRFYLALEEALEKTELPIRIVAHSTGGLIARAAFGLSPSLWQKFRSREGNRLIMLGTPSGGAYTIAQLLLGRGRVIEALTAVDIERESHGILEILTGYPGLLELLPAPDRTYNFFDHDTWHHFTDTMHATCLPQQADLDRAREVRQR